MTGRAAAYKRVLLKLSGESLAPSEGRGLDHPTVERIASELAELAQTNIQIGVVVGGGNIFRGAAGESRGMDRATADYMGMLATVINALALRDALEHAGAATRVQTAIWMQEIAEPFIRGRALAHLGKGRIVIFAGGTGNPYFSTDTTAALRALEVGAEAILMGKRVDGVYDDDPLINREAKFIEQLTYMQVFERDLKVMDSTAIALCRDNKIPIHVFNVARPGNIRRLLAGEQIGSVVG